MWRTIKVVLLHLHLKLNFACFEIYSHEENAQFALLTGVAIFIS